MKNIGICIPTIEGGVICHQEIGREASKRNLTFPEIVTHTLPLGDITAVAQGGSLEALPALLSGSINKLAIAGADFAVIPSNTVHLVINEVRLLTEIPVFSILDVVAEHSGSKGYGSVGIIGTSPTMEHRLYDPAFVRLGIRTAYPAEPSFSEIQRIIIDELIYGVLNDASIEFLNEIVAELAQDVDAILLACTELPLALSESSATLPFIDSTRILARWALAHSHS